MGEVYSSRIILSRMSEALSSLTICPKTRGGKPGRNVALPNQLRVLPLTELTTLCSYSSHSTWSRTPVFELQPNSLIGFQEGALNRHRWYTTFSCCVVIETVATLLPSGQSIQVIAPITARLITPTSTLLTCDGRRAANVLESRRSNSSPHSGHWWPDWGNPFSG